MKKYLIIALLVGCSVPVVIAQQNNNNKNKREASELRMEQYSKKRTELLKQELNLTPTQMNQVQAIYQKNAPVRLGMQSKDGINITEMNKNEIKEIEKVLDPQQKQVFIQYNNNLDMQNKRTREEIEMRSRETVDEPRPELKKDLQKK